MSAQDPHADQPVLRAGPAPLAPEAAGATWYPHSFLAPREMNQPYLDSALRRIDTIITDLLDRGIPSERITLLGFSQGACLTSEFVARHPRRYGAVLALTGGLIGPPGTPREYAGSLEARPCFSARAIRIRTFRSSAWRKRTRC